MKNPRLTFVICLFLAVLFISTAASSSYSVTYYTWVDKNGVTHVTENKEEIPKNRINTVKTFESNSKFDTVAKYYLYIKSNYHLYGKYFFYAILAIILFIILRRVSKSVRTGLQTKKFNKRMEDVEKSGLTRLNRYQFKATVRDLLEDMGYRLTSPNTQFDELIDYIGHKGGEKIAIAIHESENLVAQIVVSEVDREKQKHKCDKSLLICRTYFEENVADFAKKINCELIDKDKLAKLMQKD